MRLPMPHKNEFARPFDPAVLTEAITDMQLGTVRIMEVCGTHTMAIAKTGIRGMMPENIRILSGPGCPVCVTPSNEIDVFLELSMRPGVVIASYGDMLRVPGSTPGDNLQRRRALGADVRVVYSPLDAVEIAKDEPDKEIVFLGVGFETTAPGTAVSIGAAEEAGVKNYSVLPMLKLVEPALRVLIGMEDFNIQGFLCPGHVAAIIGAEGFRYLTEEFHIPAVISGFEAGDILTSIYQLLRQIEAAEAVLENEYTRVVRPEGNPAALAVMQKYLVPEDVSWRGLGRIQGSGLGIRPEYREYDAKVRFALEPTEMEKPTACRCGEVISGRREPKQCPLFGRTCDPENPVGPCMVSSEGACAAAYKYSIR